MKLSMTEKRRRAIAYLGSNWVLHPEYQFRPRHSNSIPVWESDRDHLRHVRDVAARGFAARLGNL